MNRRGTTNGNVRGNSVGRRRRRQWLLDTFGDGVTALCALAVPGRCLGQVDIDTMTVDRIVPGAAGGTYVRGNIQPACAPCNQYTGGKLGYERKVARASGS